MNIILAPIHKNFFAGRIWMGLDYEKVATSLQVFGHTVSIVPFNELTSKPSSFFENSLLFYSSTYNKNYLQYIKDTITFFESVNESLVCLPNLTMLKCLENKGFQEHVKKQLGISNLTGRYYGDFSDFYNDKDRLPFPFVFKLNHGALSKGVSLVGNIDELKMLENKHNSRTLKDKIAQYWNKKRSFKKDDNLKPQNHLLEQNFDDVFAKRTSFVTQEFVPNLTHDFKVLLFGDRYFVLKRQTRENDFRASGSGLFGWPKPDVSLLRYAQSLKNKFKHPFISLDIGVDANGKHYLFELQGTGFGPISVTQATEYYSLNNDGIEAHKNSQTLEEHYAYSIHFHAQTYLSD